MSIKSVVKNLLPPALYREIVKRRYRLRPSPLDPWRRMAPPSPDSNSRGQSIDRFYIEKFLGENASRIKGTVLEIADNTYTRKFGSAFVTRSDVLMDPRGAAALPVGWAGIIGDLRESSTLAAETYDCIILTQTLQFIDKPHRALDSILLALKTGGTLLMTVPGIAQRDAYDDKMWGDFYRWMPRGLRELMSECSFSEYEVSSYGNILSTAAFIYNLAYDELTEAEREVNDDDYPLIVSCVAVK